MISVVLWKWRNRAENQTMRATFQSRHVNTVASMLSRNLTIPYRVVCVTDDARGLDSSIDVVELPEWEHSIVSPNGHRFPSCYQRLRVFDPFWAHKHLGPRFCLMDVDLVIVSNIDHLLSRTEPVLMWGDPELAGVKYSGGFYIMDSGARPQVWYEFDPVESPRITKEAKLVGSDQAWISHCLYPREPFVGRAEGLYRYRTIASNTLPENAAIVQFSGSAGWEPWTRGNLHPWAQEHYR